MRRVVRIANRVAAATVLLAILLTLAIVTGTDWIAVMAALTAVCFIIWTKLGETIKVVRG